MRETRLVAVTSALLTACVVGVPGLSGGGGGGTGSDGSGSDSPPPALGLVTAPSPGSVFPGDVSTVTIHVAGTYTGDSELAIQVLADPTDLTSWTTIATAMVDDTQSFASDVQPVAGSADTGRWPQGGILRLRVVDQDGAGTALPYDANEASLTTIAVASPIGAPTDWQYLTQKAPGSDGETATYYTTIGAPTTLAAFQSTYGFGGASEAAAKYYNLGDLGIGRDMHCVAQTAGGVACYVTNYGTFGGDEGSAIAALEAATTPLATVAMVYTPPISSPNAVTFMVYGATGNLATHAQLDTVGNNTSIPENCINCHGGLSSYDTTGHVATDARFLQFDPNAFDFPTDDPSLTLQAQQAQLAALDQLAMQAAPTAAEQEVIAGSWPSSTFDASFIPAAWNDNDHDARLYSTVLAPYCRGCHISNDAGNLTFQTPADLMANAAKTVASVCGTGPIGMPVAQQTTTRFFESGARAVLLEWLGAAGACAGQ